MYEDGSENGINGTFEIYRAEGDSLYKNGEFRKAIISFTTVCTYLSHAYVLVTVTLVLVSLSSLNSLIVSV